MRCPRCGSMLKLADEQSVEVDYCPSCEGVWLDAGELEQLMTGNYTAKQKQSPKRKRGYDDYISEYGEKPRKHAGSQGKKNSRRRGDEFDWEDALDNVKKHRIGKKVLKKIKDIVD